MVGVYRHGCIIDQRPLRFHRILTFVTLLKPPAFFICHFLHRRDLFFYGHGLLLPTLLLHLGLIDNYKLSVLEDLHIIVG